MMKPTFNPAFLSEEDLIAGYTVREVDLQLLVETVEENSDATANQHVLVLGPRGMGKTTLALRVAAEVRRHPTLSEQWFPLVFSEESYEVTSPGELWLEALYHLFRATGDRRWREVYEDLKQELNEKRLYDRTLARLMDFADEQGKRLLVVIENLNTLLGEQVSKDDAWTLRHTLQNEPRIMLLATATSRFEDIDNVDRAMYELFREHPLEPLDADACRTLWQARTDEHLAGSRVRALQILTGGNPRLLTILSSFAAGSSLRSLMDDLVGLVDQYTDYFRSNLEVLPVVERKVFVTLADLWRPSTAKEVGRAARLGVNSASSLLRRLVGRGAVVETHREGRRRFYQVTERLYNIYHLMRRSGRQRSPVRFVVDFMFAFYENEQLVDLTKLIAKEACALSPGERVAHYEVYERILFRVNDDAQIDRIIRATDAKFFKHSDVPDRLRRLANLFSLKEQLRLIGEMNFGAEPERVKAKLERVKATLRDELKKDDQQAPLWATLAAVVDGDEAEIAIERALSIDRSLPVRVLAARVFWMRDPQRAENELRHAIEENELRHAIEEVEDFIEPWKLLGRLLSEQERYEEAADAWREVTALAPSNVGGWVKLGRVLWSLDKKHDAEEALRKAISLDGHCVEALSHLAGQLGLQGRLEESVEVSRQGLNVVEGGLAEDALNEGYRAGLLLMFAGGQSEFGRWDEAIESVSRALRLRELAPYVSMITTFFIHAAAKGHAGRALQVIEEADAVDLLLPLVAALRRDLGQVERVPQEVREIADDILQRIEEARSSRLVVR